ncbi:crossover junction endodeoxyribonuclease RuvC [bacterium]|nr:crossover junction endodeoxyribonuclease RuvC [bacterium]
MRILGIDPGTARVGYGIIDLNANIYSVVDYGCITTKAHTPLEIRLGEIADDIEELINKYSPDVAAVEELFFSKNTKTALSVAHARGVIIEKIQRYNIPMYSYNPMSIKQALCSDGKAKKIQMQKMTKLLLQLSEIPTPDDTADALAIALCHGNVHQNKLLYA